MDDQQIDATRARLLKSEKPLKWRDLLAANDGLQRAIVDAVKQRDATIQALEARVKELEFLVATSNTPRYVGTWKESTKKYTHGQMVTFRGALWHCNVPTRDRPGTNSKWTLCEGQVNDKAAAG